MSSAKQPSSAIITAFGGRPELLSDGLMTRTEAARVLRRHPSTVDRLARRGSPPQTGRPDLRRIGARIPKGRSVNPGGHQQDLACLLSELVRRRQSDAAYRTRLLGDAAGRELIRALFDNQQDPDWLSSLMTTKLIRRTLMFEWNDSTADIRSNHRLGILAVEAVRDVLGTELPAEFAEQLDLIDRAERRHSQAAKALAPAEQAVLVALRADPDADVDRLLLEAHVADLLHAATRKAAAQRRIAHGEFVRTRGDALVGLVADGPFENALDVLGRAVELVTLDPLEMARARRHGDMELLSDTMVAFSVVTRCCKVRDSVVVTCGGEPPRHSRFARFRNPGSAVPDATLEGFVRSIRAGADPWLPTAAQIAEAERPTSRPGVIDVSTLAAT